MKSVRDAEMKGNLVLNMSLRVLSLHTWKAHREELVILGGEGR